MISRSDVAVNYFSDSSLSIINWKSNFVRFKQLRVVANCVVIEMVKTKMLH